MTDSPLIPFAALREVFVRLRRVMGQPDGFVSSR